MDIIIEGIIVNSPTDIVTIPIKINSETYPVIRAKLQFERYKIISYLKELKNNGLIKSIHRPKNKKIKQHLKDICLVKAKMKKTIEKIDLIFK